MKLTAGERDRQIIEKKEAGKDRRAIATEMNISETTVDRVIASWKRTGDAIFQNNRKWNKEQDDNQSQYISTETGKDMFATEYSMRIGRLKRTINIGDRVRFIKADKEMTGTVEAKSTHTVLVKVPMRHGGAIMWSPSYKDIIGSGT